MRKIVVLSIIIIAVFAIPWSVKSQNISSPEQGTIHNVTTGDTLWDLSATYYGEPWRWPEIWELNRYLTNPNYIYPGLEIVIAPPPPLREDFEYVLEEEALSEGEMASREPGAKEPSVEEIMKKLKLSKKEVLASGELVRGKPPKIGHIAETTDQKLIFAPGERLYLDLEKDLPVGTELGIFRVEGPVKVRGVRGKSYKKKYIGTVRIEEKSGARIIGSITELIEEAFRIDYLSEDIPKIPELVVRYLDDKLEGGVVVGSGDNYEFAEGDTIYIKGGEDKGFAIGDVVSIYVPLSVLQELTATPVRAELTDEGNLVKVGKAVVIRTNKDFSTIFILDSRISFNASALVVRGSL
ncbi:MAG: LysM peptidoglycan-binding domain-containing protein [Deltaproteobacteria bacterium]|nr:LysM peptidoglycan-binding domain-containing protein [Deltaproteobacteria bacterium]NIS76659.1 LysM peptidoglycan-binding domain-containing protein [Deltaproteobacteria bacterium]